MHPALIGAAQRPTEVTFVATVRYIVDDVDSSLSFYCNHLGFREVMHPAPAFAMVARDDLRLLLVAPVGADQVGGGSRPMADGTRQQPGGWNRVVLEVEDLADTTETLSAGGATFRSDIVSGVGGKQVLVEDPSHNLIELFQPTLPEAHEDAAFREHPKDA